MTSITLIYGSFLIAWGYLFSDESSITSWIPAFIGAPILIAGLLAKMFPLKKKIWMHVAVLFGLLAFIGGFRFFSTMGSIGPEETLWENNAAISQLMLLITGGLYTAKSICSFKEARKKM